MADSIRIDDLNWLAGLLEGEGCFTFSTAHGYPQYSIQLIMTDEDVVARAAKILNCRYIRGKSKTKGGKFLFRAVVHGPYAIGWMSQLYPFMGERRRLKIDAIIAEWRSRGCHISAGKFKRRHGEMTPTLRLLASGGSISGGADNTTLNTGSGGDTIATDDIAALSAKVQRVKVGYGTDGNYTDASTSNPLPIIVTNAASTDMGKVDVVSLDQYTPIDVDTSSTTSENALPVSIRVGASGGSAGLDFSSGTTGAGTLRVTLAEDSTGVLSVDDNAGALTVDNAGTFATQDSQVVQDNTGFTDGTDKLFMQGYILDETAGTALTENDAAAARIDSKRAQVFVIEDETTRGQRATVTAANALKVDASGVAVPVTDNSGSLTIDGTVTAQDVAGDVAHDDADSGDPLKVGAKASNSLSGLTLVANADRTHLYAGLDGVLLVRPHCNLEDIVSGVATDTTGNSTQVIAAAGSGVKIYLTSITLANTSNTDVTVDMKSGTTTKWTFPVPSGTAGVTHSFQVPLPPNAANEAWNFDASAAASTITCSALGFKSKV